jgi:hypothetical protein
MLQCILTLRNLDLNTAVVENQTPYSYLHCKLRYGVNESAVSVCIIRKKSSRMVHEGESFNDREGYTSQIRSLW